MGPICHYFIKLHKFKLDKDFFLRPWFTIMNKILFEWYLYSLLKYLSLNYHKDLQFNKNWFSSSAEDFEQSTHFFATLRLIFISTSFNINMKVATSKLRQVWVWRACQCGRTILFWDIYFILNPNCLTVLWIILNKHCQSVLSNSKFKLDLY